MLTCGNCERPLKECCDIFYEAVDKRGEADRECVVCGECADALLATGDAVWEDE